MAIRVAVAGLGWVTLHRHIPAILRNPNFSFVGVIDRHPGRAQEIARKYKLNFYAETDDLTKVAWIDSVDALTIGTPPMAHAEQVKNAIAAGKHVLTEKPFAMTVEEGESMVSALHSQKQVLAIVHNFQFGRAANKLYRDIAKNKLGNIRRIAALQLGNPRRRLPSWYEQLPLGLFYDESPHFFYLLRRLAGGELKLQKAYGVAARREGTKTPSIVSLIYRNTANVPVTIDCQFDSALSEWYVTITGEKALGILDIFRDIYIYLPNDNTHALPDVLRTSFYAISQHIIQHVPNGLAYLRGRLDYGNDEVFSRFVRAIIEGNREVLVGISSEDALAVLKMQHEAISAVQENMLR